VRGDNFIHLPKNLIQIGSPPRAWGQYWPKPHD
jgi:hypothetical protein